MILEKGEFPLEPKMSGSSATWLLGQAGCVSSAIHFSAFVFLFPAEHHDTQYRAHRNHIHMHHFSSTLRIPARFYT
jgi:hypothetical protein